MTDDPAYLFCPADQPDRLIKAARLAGIVIADLEDGVPLPRRDLARRALVDAVAGLDRDRIVVRISGAGSPDHDADVAATRAAGVARVMLAKAEDPEELRALAGLEVIALCETPEGIQRAAELAAVDSCVGLMWGSEDLAAELGAWGSRDDDGILRPALESARNAVLMAARAGGVLAIDTVFPDVADETGLGREARSAAHSGWDAKACIHPRQLVPVRESFRPSPARVHWAESILAATGGRPDGARLVAGAMVDEPIVRAARIVLDRSAAIAT